VSESDMAMRSTAGANDLSVRAARVHSLPSPRVADKSATLQLLRRVFSFPVVLGSLLVGAVFVPARLFIVDPDIWWHIKVGDSILSTHQWPTADPYSFTVFGQPWIAYEWLGEVLWAAVMRLGGIRGLELLLIILGSAVMLALYGYTTLCSGNSKAGFVACAVLLVLANASFTLRPQMLGYLFLILTLIALERFRQGKRGAVWFLPVLFLVWVNTHGSFVVGLGVILVYWLSGLKDFRLGGIEAQGWPARDRRQIALVFLLSLSVLPITPYGTQLAVYPFNVALSQPVNVANIQEWQPMPFGVLGGKLFLALLIAFIFFQVMLRISWRLEELVLCLFGIAMACFHVRFLLLFVPFFAPLLSRILARSIPAYDRSKDRVFLNAAIIAILLGGLVQYFPSQANIQNSIAERFPVKAVEYLETHAIPGPMFNSYGYGGYLVWTLAPKQRDFIDGRADVFERGGVLRDYMHITLLKPGAFAVLRGYGVRSCLLEREQPLATVLAALPEWQRVYRDDRSVLFVRTDSVASNPKSGR
jgi:hypothetical protein